jgi:uncharacterized RDD family membrane protein YckC
MSEPIEESAVVVEPQQAAPMFTIPPIGGFWRRFWAFVIDAFVLGVLGQILVWSFSSFWFQVGPYGRLFGQSIALAYFGVMNSRIADGRTLGKRALGIAVVDRAGQPIGLGRSILRTLIVLIPATLNGWSLSVLQTPVAAWFVGVLVFGVGGAVLFTMIFNQRTRQGLHDMLCGTFVVRTDGERVAALPSVSRLQWTASAVLLGLAMVMPYVAMSVMNKFIGDRLGPMLSLHKKLAADPRFFSASVLDQTFSSSNGPNTHALRISVWCKGRPSEEVREAVLRDIAKQALASVPGIDRFEMMQISIITGYDIGIASGHVTYNDGEKIPVWRQRVGTVVRGSSQ